MRVNFLQRQWRQPFRPFPSSSIHQVTNTTSYSQARNPPLLPQCIIHVPISAPPRPGITVITSRALSPHSRTKGALSRLSSPWTETGKEGGGGEKEVLSSTGGLNPLFLSRESISYSKQIPGANKSKFENSLLWKRPTSFQSNEILWILRKR